MVLLKGPFTSPGWISYSTSIGSLDVAVRRSPSPVLGAWASGSEHVIEHCHGQLLIWKRISARAYEDGACVAARLAQRREHRDGDHNDADRAGGARVPGGAGGPAGSAGSG